VTPSELTLTASASTLTYGGSTVLQGAVTSAGIPLPFETIELQAGAYGSSSFYPLTAVTTAPDGSFLFTVSPTTNTTYRAVWRGASTLDRVVAPAMVTAGVGVRPLVSVKPTGEVSRSGRYALYPLGRRVGARGDVLPNHALLGDGSTRGAVKLSVQKRRYSTTLGRSVWVAVTVTKRPIDDSGRFLASWKPRARGTYRIRASFAGDVDHLSAKSPFRFLRVY